MKLSLVRPWEGVKTLQLKVIGIEQPLVGKAKRESQW